MFSHCQSLTNIDISKFNTSKVTNISKMFSHCYSLNFLDVTNIKISYRTNINGMFTGCSEKLIEIIKRQNKELIKEDSCEEYYCKK